MKQFITLVLSLMTYGLFAQDVAFKKGNFKNDKAGFDGSFDTIWDYAENLFTLLYTLEVVLKVTVDGWTKYSESPRNVFDFTITMT